MRAHYISMKPRILLPICVLLALFACESTPPSRIIEPPPSADEAEEAAEAQPNPSLPEIKRNEQLLVHMNEMDVSLKKIDMLIESGFAAAPRPTSHTTNSPWLAPTRSTRFNWFTYSACASASGPITG